MDIITTYVPSPAELDQAKIADYRELVAEWFAKDDPTLDTRPGSVFGDLAVNPLAKFLSALDQGVQNLQSDFLLENIANGTIYNCEYVAKYLKNFVPDDPDSNRAYGILRLTFSVDQSITIDTGTVFFSQPGDSFVVQVYNEGPIRILKVGSIAEEGSNDFVLHQTSQTRYFVDIPVMGDSTAPVLSNSVFSVSDQIPNITSISAIVDFNEAVELEGLPAKARRASNTYYAITFSTRAGMTRSLQREFPELINVSPVIPGDVEMVRSADNGYGVATPCVDVFIKSLYYGSTFKQVYKLVFDSVNDCFFGKIVTAHVPLKFTKAIYTGDNDLDLLLTTFSRSTRETSPKLSAAFSDANDYWVKIAMPRDTNGLPLVPLATDDDEVIYQYFEIEYLTDPIYRSVKDFVMSTDNKPINTDINVRLCSPLIFDEFEISYKRKKGIALDKSKASREIYDSISKVSYNNPYSDSNVIDSMFYAGASSVEDIGGVAFAYVSATDYYVNAGSVTDLDSINALSVEVPVTPISNSDLFNVPFFDETVDPTENLRYSFGPRTSAFIVEEENITYKQV